MASSLDSFYGNGSECVSCGDPVDSDQDTFCPSCEKASEEERAMREMEHYADQPEVVENIRLWLQEREAAKDALGRVEAETATRKDWNLLVAAGWARRDVEVGHSVEFVLISAAPGADSGNPYDDQAPEETGKLGVRRA